MKYLLYKLFLLGLFISSIPLLGIIACSVALSSGFPIFFKQKRIGRNGKPFIIYKFRTMRRDAETLQKKLLHHNEANGPVFKIHNDPRFTVIGKFLAHTGLDELPQLYNVLRGDMALFGPRPLPVEEAKKLKLWQQKRHAMKPGIISPWIVEGYHRQTFDAWMNSDIAYIQKKNFWYDLGIAWRTMALLTTLFLHELTSEG